MDTKTTAPQTDTGITVDQMIANYKIMHGTAPSAAAVAKLQRQAAK